jgi:hypothetical protein
MNNLTRFDSEGIEIFINEAGESFASINGAARMSGKAPTTIQRFTALRNFELQQTQVVMARGKKLITLLDEDQIVEVLEKYNPSRLKQFAKLGIRTALHQIAGYNQQPVATQSILKPLNIYNLGCEILIKVGIVKYQQSCPELSDWSEADLAGLREELNSIHPMLIQMPTDAFANIFGMYAITNNLDAGTNVEIPGWDVVLKADFEWYRQRAASSVCIKAAQQFQAQLDRTQLAPGANNLQLAQID